MSELILRTRVGLPPLRHHLIERGHLPPPQPQHVLTLTVAAAGFGKSTLLTAWAHTQTSPVAWLALEPADNEFARWMRYLVAAFESCGVSFEGAAESSLHQLVQHAPEEALRRFLNALALHPAPPLLALDDYHFIDNPDIHEAMCFLIENWPQQGHIFLASREAPPFPLAQWQVKARMRSLSTDALRFHHDESSDFLRQTMGLSLTEEQCKQIHSQTEGWVAGLQLAAVAMQTQGPGQTPSLPQISLYHEQVVVAYVEQEILAQQPEGLRDFMLQTSLLDRFNVPLCNHLTGRDDSLALLDQLEQTQLFLVRLGADDHQWMWYRYHHLFAQILRGHLLRNKPELVRSLHRKASQWFAAEGMMTEALEHAIASEDWEQAAAWLGPYLAPLQEAGENWRVAQWLDRLPEPWLRRYPHLGLAWVSAKATMEGRADSVEPLLNEIETTLLADTAPTDAEELAEPFEQAALEQREALIALLFRTRMELSWHQREYDKAHQYAQKLQQRMPQHSDAIQAYFKMLEAYILDVKAAPPEEVQALFEEAIALAQIGPRQWSPWIFSSWGVAWIDLECGRPHRAARRCQRILDEVARRPPEEAPPSFMLAAVYAMQAHLALERAHDQEGFALAETAIDRLHRNLSWEIHHYIKTIWAYAQYANNRADEAEETLLQTMRGFSFLSPRDPICASMVPFHLRRGDLNAAVKWAESCRFSLDEPFAKDWLIGYHTYVGVLMAQGALEQAHEWLNALLAFVKDIGRLRHLLDLQLLKAVLLSAQGDTEAALDQLKAAIAQATPGAYMRPFLEQQALLAPLFEQLPLPQPKKDQPTPQEREEQAYLKRLWDVMRTIDTGPYIAPEMRISGIGELQPGPGHAPPPTPPPESQLSRREREILEEVALGHTNREIASRLYISAETVKSHMKNIFQKLEVKNRAHAVSEARRLGWLERPD